ncbi:putative mediator of RNA polymerase II transcription subunit 26 isoform X2 [Agrilus planipennis]|uniref:Mediator of RNA polymerase II transcription subunit 26 isoform X2 n=1 Tax=Agrilus planipennis TaxID=224129 RepID=A0A1W4XNX0_AGRPL|nr:putative mediator of RNA polymerase II transcription subunit 26 isoform X2 [Agrilus planipennis]
MSARNKGPTGIPIFRTRIPLQQPEQLSSSNLEYPVSPEISRKPCERDIGKKVRVEDKEGVLRFFGRVHFGAGVWCGIELSRPIGKHDGHVLGVRYFFCANLCGLMAPLTKVALVDLLLADTPSDKESGPHSILFGIEDALKKDKSKKRQYLTHTESSNSPPTTKIVKNNTNPFLNDFTECSNFPDIVNSTRVAPKVEDAYVLQPERSDKTFTSLSATYENNNPFISCLNYDTAVDKTYSKDELDLRLLETRRGTYSLQHEEAQILKATLESNSSSGENTLESESNSAESVRRLSFMFTNPYCDDSLTHNITRPNVLSHSTPKKDSENDIECSPRRRCRRNVTNTFTAEEDSNKRDSLELDESLGILTPDQMADFSGFVEPKDQPKKNSSLGVHELNATIKGEDNDGLLQTTNEDGTSKSCTIVLTPDVKAEFVSSPVSLGIIDEQQLNPLDSTKGGDQSIVNDLSLGIIDVNSLTKSDTTMNMDLPLDPVDPEQRLYTTIRFEQTPSPEDLPLDPTPTLDSEPKTEPSHSKTTTSNFIMSITSITSLDTGYQGDGEMSRPASRGADHSPLFKRPLPRRAIDPMTDSDFYTESDADNHEEHNVRGDRRAQIIDGTLYGIDAQAAADIYVNNRENMDSSGIFTDIEANKVDDSSESLSRVIRTDVSPTASDTSTKSISSNSQNNAHVLMSKNNNINNNKSVDDKLNVETKNAVNRSMETPAKRKSISVSSAASSPDARSPSHASRKESTSQKSFKMPKRNVTSKVKAMLENDKTPKTKAPVINNVKKIETRKPVNRWDAVMSKISKAQNDSPKVKDVKSKVFNGFNKENVVQNVNQKSTNNKLRTRSRVLESSSSPKLKKMGSIHSSASDLSNASSAKKALGSGKKREVARVTQVLTTSKISPRSLHKNAANEIKRTPISYANSDTKAATRRAVFLPKDKKTPPNVPSKDCGKAAIKGGRTSPSVRPPLQSRATHPSAPKTAEALAVLVQHLVFTLDAFRTPSLKKQIDKSRIEVEESKLACRILEEKLLETNRNHALKIDEEKVKYRSEIAELMEQHRNNISQIHQQHQKKLGILDTEHNKLMQQLIKSHEEQLQKLRSEFNKLQKAHEQTVEILREENDSTREEIDEKNVIIEKLQKYKTESEKLKKDYECKEQSLKEELRLAHEEIVKLKDENTKAFCISIDGKDSSNKFQAVVAEVESLRAVLELKQSEIADLRKALVEANQKAELLPSVEEKVSALTARCEDLQHQLKVKFVQEQQLINDNKKLQESFREEFNHNKRLTQYNEELQWKLQQNKEVVSRVLEQAEETALNRSFLSASFNERHHSGNNHPHSPSRPQLERTLSFREHSSTSNKSNIIPSSSTPSSQKSKSSFDVDLSIDVSPPNSPKVKGVVEKSDSVSYVLEMEESPEMIANRIVRRSFRNPTPPKSTPTKSPANKRPRIKNPLSLSASANALSVGPCSLDREDRCRSRSVSVRNGDLDSSHSDDVFIWNNNSTCSSLNGEYSEMQAISVGYGVDSIRIESNSEDESTASSSSSGHF